MEDEIITPRSNRKENKSDNYDEFYILKENIINKISLSKEDNSIIIKCKKYEIILNADELSILTKKKIKNVNEAYDFINNIFEGNKVAIKEIKKNRYIKINLKIDTDNGDENKDIELVYNENNKNTFIEKLMTDYNTIINEINNLKKEFKIIQKDIKKTKDKFDNMKKKTKKITDDNKKSDLNYQKFNYINSIVTDAYSNFWLNDTFIAFKSINNVLELIYANQNKSIISYDIVNNKIIKEIKDAHNNYITNLRYYLDTINKRDLFLSISSDDNNLKLWNINNNYECLLDMKSINEKGFLNSACFLKNNCENYIITSNNIANAEPIKVYDFKGNKIKEINDSNDDTDFIDTYYDNNLNKVFIITCCKNFSKSYDYNNNKIHFKYFDNNNPIDIIVYIKEDITELIESNKDGNIRIYNFHSGLLLSRIKVGNNSLREICLWDNEYLFVGCDENKTIKIIDYNNGIIIKELKGHKNKVLSIKKIIHPKYGKCLLSQSAFIDSINLWGIKTEYI